MQKSTNPRGSALAAIIIVMSAIGVVLFGVSITPRTEVETRSIAYEYEHIDDPDREVGYSYVKQRGVYGEEVITYQVTGLGESGSSRKIIDRNITKKPVPEITIRGTKVVYTCSNGEKYDTAEGRDECERYISWSKGRDAALAECNADTSKYNCWYDAYPGTYIHWTWRQSYGYRTGAICWDGWRSYATGRGACSHHGGVQYWLYE